MFDAPARSIAPLAAPRLLAWLGYAVSLSLVGQCYWRAPLGSDESKYYWPAIRAFAAQLPQLTISDYALPNPPLALILQALTYAGSGASLLATRALTSVFAALLAAFVLASAERGERSVERLLAAAYVLCLPALLNDGFLLKHHVFSVCGLVGAVYCMRSGPPTLGREAALLACMSLAVLSSQAAVPFAVYLLARTLLTASLPPWQRALRLAVMALPLACLGLLFLLWRGFEPPTYKTYLLEQHIGLLTFNSGQLALGLYVSGLWFLPLAPRLGKTALVRTALLYPCAVLLVHFSGGMIDINDLRITTVGPTITLLRTLCRGNYPVIVALFALGVAIGAERVIDELLARNWRGPVPMIALYLAFMNFVPYRFESYYIYLVVPWLVWDRDRLLDAMQQRRWRIYAACGALMGVTYMLAKLYRLSHHGLG